MKIEVELYGTLKKLYPGNKRSEGIELEIPDGTRVIDLLDHLKIPDQRGVVVTMDGKILKSNQEIPKGGSVRVFQTIHGG